MRQMILAHDDEQRKIALDNLIPFQRSDFEGIYRALKGRPATIRLLDPPLHEFLPHSESEQRSVAVKLGVSQAQVQSKVEELAEVNPMMGFRGCRLAVIYPEILKMQVTAIMEAALNVAAEGVVVKPEIMIPLITSSSEFKLLRKIAEETIKGVFAANGNSIPFTIGTMIEVPRAALVADEIAADADFFSFGTNDLTQMTCGFSRDDAGRFLKDYVRQGIYEYDPFEVIDVNGVGKLVKMATALGRSVKPDMKIGVCGEHGGEAKSVAFFVSVGLDYVSCSPFRVPVAKLAVAQAFVKNSASVTKKN
jgi:pyruvate,orthophosphate dikinase